MGRGPVDPLPEADGEFLVVPVHVVPEVAGLDLLTQGPEPRVVVPVVPRKPQDVLYVVVEQPRQTVGQRSIVELADLHEALVDVQERVPPNLLEPWPAQE